jgi:1,6-anhydro-N-acetylmuramate kinase
MRAYLAMSGEEVKAEEEKAGAKLEKLDQLDIYVRAVFRAAIAGSGSAQRLIRDTIDGLPVQTVQHEGGEDPLTFNVHLQDGI